MAGIYAPGKAPLSVLISNDERDSKAFFINSKIFCFVRLTTKYKMKYECELLTQHCPECLLILLWTFFYYWRISCCVDRFDASRFPLQHDDFPLLFKSTVRVRSIVPPPLAKSVLRSIFFHCFRAITNAFVTFCDVFADVSI